MLLDESDLFLNFAVTTLMLPAAEPPLLGFDVQAH